MRLILDDEFKEELLDQVRNDKMECFIKNNVQAFIKIEDALKYEKLKKEFEDFIEKKKYYEDLIGTTVFTSKENLRYIPHPFEKFIENYFKEISLGAKEIASTICNN